MIVPYFDEQIVDDAHQIHLDHIPHLRSGKEFAVPYVYVLNEDGSIGKKLTCSYHLKDNDTFVRTRQSICFLSEDVKPGTRIAVFYEYNSPNVKKEILQADTSPEAIFVY